MKLLFFELKDLNINIFSIITSPYSRLTNHRKRLREVLCVVAEHKVINRKKS